MQDGFHDDRMASNSRDFSVFSEFKNVIDAHTMIQVFVCLFSIVDSQYFTVSIHRCLVGSWCREHFCGSHGERAGRMSERIQTLWWMSILGTIPAAFGEVFGCDSSCVW